MTRVGARRPMPVERRRGVRRWMRLLPAALLAAFLAPPASAFLPDEGPLPAATASQARTAAPDYPTRLAAYRRGQFIPALRASLAVPFDRLEDEANDFRGEIRGMHEEADLSRLAAAVLHFDLAAAAGMEPEHNERIARGLLADALRGRREDWLREAHLGLVGIYAAQGVLEHAVRAAKFLVDEFPARPEVRLVRGGSRSSSVGALTTPVFWTKPSAITSHWFRSRIPRPVRPRPTPRSPSSSR